MIKKTFLGAILATTVAPMFCSCSRTELGPSPIPSSGKVAIQSGPGQPISDPYSEIPERQPVMHRTLAGEPAPDGWCLAESTRGRFSVMLPGKFNDSLLKMPTTTGGVSAFHSVMTKTAEGADFNATYFEIIGERPAAAGSPVEMMVDRFKNLGGTISKKEVVLGGLPGEQLLVQAQGTTAEMAIVKTPSGDYMLAVQINGPIGADLQKDIDRFLQSFKITKSTR